MIKNDMVVWPKIHCQSCAPFSQQQQQQQPETVLVLFFPFLEHPANIRANLFIYFKFGVRF